ncbi:hypothetical protein KY358_05420 [Candidatus Woesearchaeota archaeon]|nr:hypothetical protein [Candidatus Woesearchaeota archaeon]
MLVIYLGVLKCLGDIMVVDEGNLDRRGLAGDFTVPLQVFLSSVVLLTTLIITSCSHTNRVKPHPKYTRSLEGICSCTTPPCPDNPRIFYPDSGYSDPIGLYNHQFELQESKHLETEPPSPPQGIDPYMKHPYDIISIFEERFVKLVFSRSEKGDSRVKDPAYLDTNTHAMIDQLYRRFYRQVSEAYEDDMGSRERDDRCDRLVRSLRTLRGYGSLSSLKNPYAALSSPSSSPSSPSPAYITALFSVVGERANNPDLGKSLKKIIKSTGNSIKSNPEQWRRHQTERNDARQALIDDYHLKQEYNPNKGLLTRMFTWTYNKFKSAFTSSLPGYEIGYLLDHMGSPNVRKTYQKENELQLNDLEEKTRDYIFENNLWSHVNGRNIFDIDKAWDMISDYDRNIESANLEKLKYMRKAIDYALSGKLYSDKVQKSFLEVLLHRTNKTLAWKEYGGALSSFGKYVGFMQNCEFGKAYSSLAEASARAFAAYISAGDLCDQEIFLGAWIFYRNQMKGWTGGKNIEKDTYERVLYPFHMDELSKVNLRKRLTEPSLAVIKTATWGYFISDLFSSGGAASSKVPVSVPIIPGEGGGIDIEGGPIVPH